MNTQHTPGPWKIGAYESGQIAVDGANGTEVTGFIDPADAQLIAAAPDLLEALLECLPHLERDDQHIDALGWKMPHYTKACEAIAKATGSKP